MVIRLGEAINNNSTNLDPQKRLDFASVSFKDAVQWCEQDLRWIELCGPGSTKEQRDLFRKGLLV